MIKKGITIITLAFLWVIEFYDLVLWVGYLGEAGSTYFIIGHVLSLSIFGYMLFNRILGGNNEK